MVWGVSCIPVVDAPLQLDRARDKLLPALFQELNLFIERHSNGSPQLCVHRMKVTFQREPGEGSGVLRSLFTAVAEVRQWLLADSFPDLYLCESLGSAMGNSNP